MRNETKIGSRYDAVVVGARVAGAATAMLLARAGKRVLAVDKSACGSDTTSTHAIMRAGVMQLHRWGVLDRLVVDDTPAIRRTTFHYGDERMVVDIKERDGVDALYAPRRTVLDVALVDAARAAGADVIHGASVNRLLRDASGRVTGVVITDPAGKSRRVDAGIVIGADGTRSRVARAVEAGTLHQGRSPGSVIYGYFGGFDLDGTHWYYNNGVAAGVIPTNDRVACVFAGMAPERYATRQTHGLDTLFADVLRDNDPALARLIAGAKRVGKLHPFGGAAGYIRRAWGPGWALVGDSGCFKDPITAHGITDALRDAELLANAILAGADAALESYQSVRDDFAVEFLELSDRIASFDWDLDTVKTMHRQLSKLMNGECDMIRAFDADVSVRGNAVA